MSGESGESGESGVGVMVRIRLPEGLAKYCEGERTVSVKAATMSVALEGLVSLHPSVGPRLLDAEGRLTVHLMLLCNDRAVSAEDLAGRELVEGDELAMVFLAGGG